MKKVKAIGLLVMSVMVFSSFAHANVESGKLSLKDTYGRLPLYFIKNEGQLSKQVKFYEKGGGHSTFFTNKGVYLSLVKGKKRDKNLSDVSPPKTNPEPMMMAELVKLMPVGANKNTEIVAEGTLEGKVNYFTGTDAGKWKTDIPTYKAVVYKELYKGIDMKFYGNNSQLEYDIIVKPAADPSRVRLSYEGIENLQVTANGELKIGLKGGDIIQRKPVVYQKILGKMVKVEGRFKILNQKSGNDYTQFAFGFEIGSYNKNYPLVIDPVLIYSTYLGGDNWDAGYGIAVDTIGNVYVAGVAYSGNFPVVSPIFGNNGGGYDAFVTKIDASGSSIVYSTYLGGSNHDFGSGIAVDSSGNAYVTGYTYSNDFPTVYPLQGIFGGNTDAFVAKINASGNALDYSTYIGGSDYDIGNSIAVTASDAYVTGSTDSTDFPTVFPLYGAKVGHSDAFVSRINANGSNLVYSTYLGGSGWDEGYGIAVDSSGNAYITGWTGSTDFPTAYSIQGTLAGYYDAFVTKINASGSNIVYSTYLGGSSLDFGRGIAVDPSGAAYVTGNTYSLNFPTVSAIGKYREHDGDSDAFATKISTSGNALAYSMLLGGKGDDCGLGIAVDASGSAYVAGYTTSTNFPVVSPIYPANMALYRTEAGGADAFVTKIHPTDSRLLYSTYLGGSDLDYGQGIAVDMSGNAYITGQTHSTDFPTALAIYGSTAGWVDGFVTKIGEREKK